MHEYFVTGKTLPEAYHSALTALEQNGDIADCSDWGQRQKEVSLTFVVEEPLCEPMISKCFIGDPRSLEQYRQEMLDGILDFEVDVGNWHYTYHRRFENQIQFVIDELKRNPESRRAIMSIRDNTADMGNDSPACLQSIQYFIRSGQLHCKVLFRSNDAAKATFMNAFALIMLQKRFADELGVKMGSYTHRANSFHCYEKDWEMLGAYINRIAAGDVTYDYAGDWDEQMEDAKADIAETVRVLKEER